MTSKEKKKSSLEIGLTIGKNARDKLKHPLILLSERLKKGFADIVELRQGLKLIINNYKPKRSVEVNFQIDNPPLDFVYCLSGKAEARIIDPQGSETTVSFEAGMNTVFYFPNTKGVIKLYAEDPIKLLSLHISPEFLNNFIEGDLVGLPEDFADILNGKLDKFFILNNAITPLMQVSVSQIFDTKIKGAARKMFFESKALELMSLQIQQLISEDSGSDISLTEKELSAVKTIKNLLNKNFKEHPSLTELAKSSGMTHTKLNFAFRKQYDSTVFEYIRKLRLEYSVQLLRERKLTVTEIAYEAGWSNPSHFSKEFTKHYGVSPKKYQLDK